MIGISAGAVHMWGVWAILSHATELHAASFSQAATSSSHSANNDELEAAAIWKKEAPLSDYKMKWCPPMQTFPPPPQLVAKRTKIHLKSISLGIQIPASDKIEACLIGFATIQNMFPRWTFLLSHSSGFSKKGCNEPRPSAVSTKALCQRKTRENKTLKSCLATPLISSQSPFPSSSPEPSVSSQTVIQTADSSGRELLPEILAGNVHLQASVSSLGEDGRCICTTKLWGLRAPQTCLQYMEEKLLSISSKAE